jgi:hypothetical protein
VDHQPHPSSKLIQATAKSASVKEDRFDQLQGQLNQLSAQIQQMTQPQPYQQRPQYDFRPSFKKGNKKGQRQYAEMPCSPDATTDLPPSQSRDYQKVKIICYRCHQEGHVKKGCRVRLYHQQSQGHLNFSRPSPEAKDPVRSQGGPSTRRH